MGPRRPRRRRAGKEISLNILALSSCRSAVTPCCRMVGTAAERYGFVYRVTA